MRSLSDKFPVATFALALGIEGCAPATPPKQPEVIIVDIPPAMVVIENCPEAEPLPRRREKPQAKREMPLTVERILAEAPARSTVDIDADIEKYREHSTPNSKPGYEVIHTCGTAERALECNELSWAEHKRVRLENEQAFFVCDQINNDDQKWHACVMAEAEKDDQARTVRAYCSQQILECVEVEFRK